MSRLTKEAVFNEINQTQDEYIDKLIDLMNKDNTMKSICFNSPTGTGKTKMMSKLINKLPGYYFIITTLSKSQLHLQTYNNLEVDCLYDNFKVYGSADYKINSKLQAEEILSNIPSDKECIWLRDEGHIKTNRFEELLMNRCYKVINFSATNPHSDIQCNFTHTMMLRTVNQTTGSPKDAIQKLLEVKEQHKAVPHYNPCAIFRCVNNDKRLYDTIVSECNKNNLKYIDITDTSTNIAELCEDDNEYDVIINKFKLVEGIDIRRSHILYMDNQPSNNVTTIQSIGRCRRNALLYRNDIDIFAPENEQLLKDTRECYVYYNVKSMRIDTDENGELQSAFCNYISCEELKPNITISVVNGQLPNGLTVIELKGQSGNFTIEVDKNTGYNVIGSKTGFYNVEIRNHDNYIYTYPMPNHPIKWKRKIHIENISKLPLHTTEKIFDYSIGDYIDKPCTPFYVLEPTHSEFSKYKEDKEYPDLFEDITDDEKYLLDTNCTSPVYIITQTELNDYKTFKYRKIFNDEESAIIGTDTMHQIKDDEGNIKWCESKSVSNKISSYNKFNDFLSKRYTKEIEQAKYQCFNGANKTKIHLNKKCMSLLGYCVEYYSKYLVYGRDFLARHIILAKKESHTDTENEFIVVRACMLKCREMLTKSYGRGVAKVVQTISLQELIKDEYKKFVETVITLAERTAMFVKENLYLNETDIKDDIDPNLSIRHITGLADYITKDIILDVKVRNNININCVKQILAYHYLSTKRSDLHIKKVIIYDATSDKYVSMDITKDNQIVNDFTDNTKLKQCNVLTCNYKFKKEKEDDEVYFDDIVRDSGSDYNCQNDMFDNGISHIGETIINHQGLKMVIIDYRGYNDIDVKFLEDNTVIKNKSYRNFLKGHISNPVFDKYKFNRTGETKKSSKGQDMTIIVYRSASDIDVQFEDGYIAKHKTYKDFQERNIGNPNYYLSRVGETNINKQGYIMTIIKYNGTGDITIQFEDGTIVEHKPYNRFKKGTIINPNIKNKRLGETNKANNGQMMTIIRYGNAQDIDVKFEDGAIVEHKTYYSFRIGEIGNPFLNCNDSKLYETNTNHQGELMTLIRYGSYSDIDIKFNDGTIVCHREYRDFKNGCIRHPNCSKSNRFVHYKERVGETSISNNGQTMTIIVYRSSMDIDIQFEDNTVVEHKCYADFKKGRISNPNSKNPFLRDRLGETNIATNGQTMTIIVYRNKNDLDIEFEDGTVVEHIRYQSFKQGWVKNPNYKKDTIA